MMRSAILLVVLVAGCATQPAPPEAAQPLAPGTVAVHLNGRIQAGFSIGR